MSKFSHGAEAIERLALHYQDLVAAREALQELGGLDAAKKDLHTSITRMKDELSTTKDEITKARVKLAAVNAEMEKMGEKANEEAKRILGEAQAKASAILTDASNRADSLLGEAHDKFTSKAAAANKAAGAAERKVKDAENKLADIEDARRLAQAELDAVNQKLADARAAIKKMMDD